VTRDDDDDDDDNNKIVRLGEVARKIVDFFLK
jgi:hypothetical protein